LLSFNFLADPAVTQFWRAIFNVGRCRKTFTQIPLKGHKNAERAARFRASNASST